MRGRDQIEMTVHEYHDAQRAHRKRLLAQLQTELDRARAQNADWIVWIDKRRRGEHDHGLKRANGERACCPVEGCPIVGALG